MSKETDLVNDLYDRFAPFVEGSFHNDLWQIIVNDSLQREENPDKVFVFSLLPGKGKREVVVIEKNQSGYIPCNFQIRGDSVEMKTETGENMPSHLVRVLTKRIFDVDADQIADIEISSYRKPMQKAEGEHPYHPVIYNYGDAAGRILTKGNSVVVALQVRVGEDFLPPTIHRVPSSKTAVLMAQFHANIVSKEIRLTFPVEDELDRKDWVEYVSRLNGSYFRPKEPSIHD